MANILRRLYRRALDTELGVVGDELAEVADQLEAVTERYHRLQARVGMKALREERKGAHQNDDALIAELRAATAGRGRPPKSNGGETWPENE